MREAAGEVHGQAALARHAGNPRLLALLEKGQLGDLHVPARLAAERVGRRDHQAEGPTADLVERDDLRLARLDDFIQIANSTRFYGSGKGTINPLGGIPLQEISAYQIAGSEIIVAGHGYQR